MSEISKDPKTGAFLGVKKIFITGANRGLGLGLAQVFLQRGHHIVAAARNIDGARDLWELERDYGTRCQLLELDVTSDRDADLAAKTLGDTTIDVLVNNAGILLESNKDFESLSFDAIAKTFAVNSIAPLRITRALLPNLARASMPVVATLSSKMGSIADNSSGGAYAYRASKAAVNALYKSFALDFKNITAVVLHPGWVQTDMGGAGATLSVEQSTESLADVILGLKKQDSGRFFDYLGQAIPW